MSSTSSIEWTDATWNPITGCTKVSPGCKNCYAEAFAERFRGVPGHPFEQGFDLRLWENRLDFPAAWRRPRRIFVNSMSDLFLAGVPDAFIERVFVTMTTVRRHVYQVLTKRPERMADFVRRWCEKSGEDLPGNIWLGTSIESQPYVARAAQLRGMRVPVRWLSCEPLLGPLDLRPHLGGDGVTWVVTGGESGHRARPLDAAWVRGIREQCLEAGVPFFHKQNGGPRKWETGRELDGRTWDEYPALESASA